MKLHFLAAGALLLGTSAFALHVPPPVPVKDTLLASSDAAWAAAAAAKLGSASAIAWDQQVSTQLPSDTPDAVDTSQGNPDLDLAEAPPAGEAEGVQTAIADTSEGSEVLAADADTAVQTAAEDMSQYQGTGGPETEVRTGYPACSATVTDSCIQLYERGVTGEGN